MRKIAFIPVLAALGFAAHAQGPAFIDRARVQSVEPQYEQVQVPRDACTSQWVEEPRPLVGGNGYGGAIIGGVAGGLIGNQVGKGHGREAATAAGAVIGAIAGDRIASQGAPVGQREVRTCQTVHEVQTRLNGYRVTYEYRGQQYTTFLREQPGSTLPVRVSVTPLDEREARRY
jgi:uncharacterized protein YcfJ